MSDGLVYRPKRENWADTDSDTFDANLREELEALGSSLNAVAGTVNKTYNLITQGGGGGTTNVILPGGNAGTVTPSPDEKVKVDMFDQAGYLLNKIYGMPPYVRVTQTPDGIGGSFLLIEVDPHIRHYCYSFPDTEELVLSHLVPHVFYTCAFFRPVEGDEDPHGPCILKFEPQTVRQYAYRLVAHFGAAERGFVIITGGTEPVVPW